MILLIFITCMQINIKKLKIIVCIHVVRSMSCMLYE